MNAGDYIDAVTAIITTVLAVVGLYGLFSWRSQNRWVRKRDIAAEALEAVTRFRSVYDNAIMMLSKCEATMKIAHDEHYQTAMSDAALVFNDETQRIKEATNALLQVYPRAYAAFGHDTAQVIAALANIADHLNNSFDIYTDNLFARYDRGPIVDDHGWYFRTGIEFNAVFEDKPGARDHAVKVIGQAQDAIAATAKHEGVWTKPHEEAAKATIAALAALRPIALAQHPRPRPSA